MSLNHQDRAHMTKEHAFLVRDRAEEWARIAHVLDNQDGTFSVMSHSVCDFCDYCAEGDDFRQTVHIFKKDPYEIQNKEEGYDAL